MKVTYRELDIYEQFEQARQQARSEGRRIGSFVIGLTEFEEFIRLGSDPDHLFAGYTMKNGYEGNEYFYKDIPVVLENNSK